MLPAPFQSCSSVSTCFPSKLPLDISMSTWMLLPPHQSDGLFCLTLPTVKGDPTPLSCVHLCTWEGTGASLLTASHLPATFIRRVVLTENTRLLFSIEVLAVSASWCYLKEGLARLLPSLALNCSERWEKPKLWGPVLRLRDFDSAAFSSSFCCYQKAELGIALTADLRLITACWQTVLGNTDIVYVITVLLSATNRFWFHRYQAATETLVWGAM